MLRPRPRLFPLFSDDNDDVDDDVNDDEIDDVGDDEVLEVDDGLQESSKKTIDTKISRYAKNPPASSDSDLIEQALLRAGEFHLDFEDKNCNIDVGIGDRITALSRLQAAARGARFYAKGEAETLRKVLDEIDLITVEGLIAVLLVPFYYSCGLAIR
ncbi:hypothetical protein ACHAXA_001476 [Cyclostephanos tholiformis]|uniref:Uncharacterized protein n=1 Tax=Cyclostephanos tholiformis TaxID=382380 RepID=A0ABD3RYZ5_9STRA